MPCRIIAAAPKATGSVATTSGSRTCGCMTFTLVRDRGILRYRFFFSFPEDMRRGLAAAAPEFRKMMTLDIAKSPSLAAAVHHASIIELTPAQMRKPGLVAACRKAGLDVMVYYGGDDVDLHNEIALAGVDYVNIDRPDLFDTARHAARLPELA